MGGETGWMFVQQAQPILEIAPDAFFIEMVANCLNVKNLYGDGKSGKRICKI